MAEQTFRSPNFFEREIDLSAPTVQGPLGIPAGLIGTANKGPAFVPVTIRDFSQFVQTFGNLDPKKPAPYAAKQFLENKTSLTYTRVLGAGANTTPSDVAKTQNFGRVKSAGFNVHANGGDKGGVYFLMSQVSGTLSASIGSPDFENNDSFSGTILADGNVINAQLFMPVNTSVMMFHATQSMSTVNFAGKNDGSAGLDVSGGTFKLVISSSVGSSYSMDDGLPGIKIFTASLNPASPNYVGKILNTDSTKFQSEQHYLYANFPVDVEVAVPLSASILSGTSALGFDSVSYRNLFGTMDTRYVAPKTSNFISQPFGNVEHDLFYFESVDDGEYANNLYKISITNLKVSVDESNPYGSFTVQVRDFYDNDFNPNILEQFNDCNLNPESPNYVANMIGDRKISYSFDVNNPNEKRIFATGNYVNNSKYIRVIVNQNVKDKKTPKKCLPFGFRGPTLLKTSNSLSATGNSVGSRLCNSYYSGVSTLVPPIPYRSKVTRGLVGDSAIIGDAGRTEFVSPGLYWGVKFERNDNPMDPNNTTEPNRLIENLTKFMGIEKMDALTTGSWSDDVNNNKFTLARVALMNGSLNDITGSASTHMLRAVYRRDGKADINDYTLNFDSFGQRVTLASLLNATDQNYDQSQAAISAAANFNRFSQYAKFTTFMYGGFDGVNILDKDAKYLNDKSTTFQAGGGANVSYTSPGLSTNQAGIEKDNNGVSSYRTAIDIMTDPFQASTNILAVPGIRESYITDYAGTKCRDYSLSIYIMDIPSYDDVGSIIFDDSTAKPNIEKTAAALESRSIDNSYIATYFPDVFINDETNRRKVKVPSSIAAISALGFNDRVSYPWFAPAGFNRAALDFVSNVAVRLNVSDRDRLYDARINPIATFPKQGFVIYGQKTLQVSKSALDRVNVRRLLLEVKRTIVDIANKLVFEQNTPAVRNKFVADSALQLGFIQAQAGIEAFQVVMNESNNTQDDIDNNRLRGRIVVVPTRVIEFIAIDFIVTNSGVQFV